MQSVSSRIWTRVTVLFLTTEPITPRVPSLCVVVIGLVVRVFAGHLGLIPDRVIPKTFKIVLDASLVNTQHYKVRIKGKVEQSWEKSSTFPYIMV